MPSNKKKREMAQAQAQQDAKGKKKEIKKVKLKDYKFLPQYKWLIGFRSGKHWKRIVALTYYISCTAFLFVYLGLYLMMMSMPFALFTAYDSYKKKDVYSLKEWFISFAVLFAGLIILYFEVVNNTPFGILMWF